MSTSGAMRRYTGGGMSHEGLTCVFDLSLSAPSARYLLVICLSRPRLVGGSEGAARERGAWPACHTCLLLLRLVEIVAHALAQAGGQ